MNWKDYLRLDWHGGQLLTFSGLDGPTSYEKGLVARTTVSPAGLEIVDPVPCKLIFEATPLRDVLFATDHFRFRTETGETTGVLIDAHHLLINGTCAITGQADGLQILQQDGRILIGVEPHFDPRLIRSDIELVFEKRNAWLKNRMVSPALPEHRRQTLFRAFSMMKGQVYSPEGAIRRRWTTPDRWPHKDMWLWDSAFHAIGWRHLDVALAREMIEAVFDVQQPDGLLPHRMAPSGAVSAITQPPVLGSAVKLVNEIAPDAEWIERLYPKLCAYVQWDLRHRDSDGGGLLEWFIEEDVLCRSGESGMDNSPRFDNATLLDAVDFNSYLALECELLAGFATSLGRKDEAILWREHHSRLCRLINERLWSEKDRFYFDFDPQKKKRSPVIASAGFLPLLCGAANPQQARDLAAHLGDPSMFATRFPIPSIAARDREHYSKDLFRGPTWVNINWLIAQGFDRYQMKDQAEAVRHATILEIERTCGKYGTFFEFFDDRQEIDPPLLLRKGVCAPDVSPYRQVIHEFGWTAALYVDMVLSRRGA